MKDFNAADVKFVQGMIEHHAEAVRMSKSIYVNGQDQQVKEWAQAIWDSQSAEIEAFKQWLAERGLPLGAGSEVEAD